MPQLNQALAGRRAHGGRAVRPYSERQVDACVLEQGLHAEADARSSDDPAILSFPAAEGKADLGRRQAHSNARAEHQATA